jgi:transketolase
MTRPASLCAAALEHRADTDRRIWVLDGDLADSYGLCGFAERHPDRFIMAGIAEQNMVSMAAGMAAAGARPFVFSFAAFLAFRAADQVRVCLAQSGQPVTLVASHSGGLSGRNGRSHAAVGDIAAILAMPGITMWSPADPAEVELALDAAMNAQGPTYIRLPRDPLLPLDGEAGTMRRLPAERRSDTVIVATGIATQWALEARQALRRRGGDAEILSIARLHPPPEELSQALRAARRIAVIEDHVRCGGLADMVARVAKRLPDSWHGWPDFPPGGDPDRVLRTADLDPETIAQTIAAGEYT